MNASTRSRRRQPRVASRISSSYASSADTACLYGRAGAAQLEMAAHPRGVLGEALAVAIRAVVASLDRQREADDDRFGGVELVGVPFDAQQRANPRAQFVRVERLRYEIVGAGVDA